MTCVTVKTQTQLDAALSGDADCVHIESDAGVWLRVSASGKRLWLSGNASARLYGSASAELYDSASARLYDNASAELSGSASAELSGSASARLYGNASARLYGNASARLYDNASAELYDSASARLYDNASAEAAGASSVHAHNRSKVTAGPHVAVHLHSAQATVTGGVVIDLTQLNLNDPRTWCDHHGVDIVDGQAHLFKSVDMSLTAGHGYTPIAYPVGETVRCTDWRDDNGCGGGLHASPRPWQAKQYAHHPGGVRYLLVAAPVESIRPIDADKCKAPAWTVLAEVDASGEEFVALAASGAEGPQ